jgi:hypothetical protein
LKEKEIPGNSDMFCGRLPCDRDLDGPQHHNILNTPHHHATGAKNRSRRKIGPGIYVASATTDRMTDERATEQTASNQLLSQRWNYGTSISIRLAAGFEKP